MKIIRRAIAGAAITVVGVLTVAAPASSAVTCSYDQAADVLTVTANANDDSTNLIVNGGEIQVFAALGQVTCSGAGGPPTVTNTGDVTLVNGGESTSWFVIDPEDFAPGTAGTGEVRTVAALGAGTDHFGLFDTDANNDFWVLGASGINWNGDMDVDASFLPMGAVEQIQLRGGPGNDAITAQGQDGAGAQFPGPGLFVGLGENGDDVIEGADTGDLLFAGSDIDTLRGFGGADILTSGPGTKQLQGGTGIDRASYPAGQGVTVDLGIAGPQNTGDGTDTLTGIEGVEGSLQADVLIGNGEANALLGRDGNDTLEGRGGNDPLQGGDGVDTARYESAPSGVNASLAAGTATGGAGNDSLNGIEDLIGSPFADTLIGDVASNTITALGGNDTVSARQGADAVRIRDGGPDTASCGTEIDTAIADRASVDSVNPDCENVDFLPEEGDGGGGTAPSNDFTFGTVKKNKRKGTAKLTIEIVEGPGELDLTKTKKVKADDEAVEGEGATEERLAIKPKGKAKKKLNKKGKARVRAEVTYIPDGGEPNTQSKKLKLKKRR
jgi:Ca2+-binding RTX toxin-like protein